MPGSCRVPSVKNSWIIKLWLILVTCWATGASAITLQPTDQRLDLGPAIELLADPRGEFGIDIVSSPEFESRFRPVASSDDVLNLGFTGTTYWLRLRLQRTSDAPEHWLLELPHTTIDYVDFHVAGQPPLLTGTRRPLSSRPFRERYFVFPLAVPTTEQTVYLRVSSSNALTIPLRIWQPDARLQSEGNALLLQYLYYGGLLALLVHNLLLALSLRDRRFLLYALYALPLGLGMLAGNGLGRVLLWPDSHAFDEVAQSCLLGLAGAMAMLFAREFLQTRVRLPRIDRLMLAISAGFLCLSALLGASLWWPLPVIWLNQLMFIAGVLMGGLVLLVSAREYWLGQRGARFFLLSWAILWLGVLVASLRAFGWLPTNVVTAYAIQLSSVAEMLLLSLALAEIMHAERRAREQAQAQALEASRRSGERLEAEVRQRTAELRVKAEQLERSLASEQQVLAQYVRFGSMISHEFRNPLAVIDSQVRLLGKEHEQGRDRLPERLPVVQRAVRRLSSMFDQWLKSDRLGQSLQEISPHTIPLRDWLEHLVEGLYCLSEHQIELVLQPDVEQVFGDDHLLEIALGNLVENASKYAPPGTSIRLQTCSRPGQVGICVTDQGPGIALEHQRAVFDAFYRIQPEGSVRGMGLGLSIVQRIALAHGGELTLDSQPGAGCSFCLWLPATREAVPK
jgi:two-component system, sensor histidine kinase LadS